MTFSAVSLAPHLSLTSQLPGWKELPSEDSLVSTYIKIFGQEIAYVNIDKDAIQQTMMVLTRLLSVMLNNFLSLSLLTYLPNLFHCLQSLTGSSKRQLLVKKVMEEVQQGISGQWTLPMMVGELRHIVPTVVGVPLELSLCGTTLAQAAADGELGTPKQAVSSP